MVKPYRKCHSILTNNMNVKVIFLFLFILILFIHLLLIYSFICLFTYFWFNGRTTSVKKVIKNMIVASCLSDTALLHHALPQRRTPRVTCNLICDSYCWRQCFAIEKKADSPCCQQGTYASWTYLNSESQWLFSCEWKSEVVYAIAISSHF